MLLLVTIGLVLVGAVALVIGFVSNSLGPIYLSIACSVIAGIVLVLFSRMARRQEGGSAAPSAPSRPSSWGPPASASEPPSAPATRVDIPATPPPPPPVSRPEPPRYQPEPEPEPEFDFAPEREPVGATAGSTRSVGREPMPEDEDFPIQGYDTLRASQIVDHLPDLSLEELDMVREREEQGKNRATIIRRVDLRIDELESVQDEAEAAPMDEEPAPEAEREAAVAGRATDDDFPIEDYDSLSSDEIVSMLDDLDDDELDMVAAREERGRNRVEILEYIDDMFEEVPIDEGRAPASPPAASSPPARPAAKKAAAKKAAAKKAAAKKAPAAGRSAAKKAAPLAGAPLAKAPAAKAPAAKAPAAKAPAAKGRGVKKAAAPASPGTKSAGRRTSAAKEAAAKAVPPVAAPAPPAGRKAAKKATPAKKRPR